MKERVIFGANSAIAEAVAKLWARRGDRLTLIGRNGDRLAAIAKDLQARGASQVEVAIFDFTDTKNLSSQVEEFFLEKELVDTLLVAPGFLGYGSELESGSEKALEVWRVNFEMVAVIILAAKAHFVKNSFGTIAAFSATEADLGRSSSYYYGSAKAALRIFLAGLREEMQPKKVKVTTIIPGRVRTPLTKEVPKEGRFWTSPEVIAEAIVFKIDQGGVIYAPFYWRYLSWLRRSLPEAIARKLKF